MQLFQLRFLIKYRDKDSVVVTIAREINPDATEVIWKEFIFALLARIDKTLVKSKNYVDLEGAIGIEFLSKNLIQPLDTKGGKSNV